MICFELFFNKMRGPEIKKKKKQWQAFSFFKKTK